jgi:hypothetical protein
MKQLPLFIPLSVLLASRQVTRPHDRAAGPQAMRVDPCGKGDNAQETTYRITPQAERLE